MPDLGKYADTVFFAYATSIVLLACVIIISIIKARRVRRELEIAEHRRTTSRAQ